MAYNSTTDNLLSNIVTNTDSAAQGDFPNLVGMIVASTGATFLIKTPQDFAASAAYVYEGSDIPIKDIVVFELVNATNGKHTANIDTLAVSLVKKAATDFLAITGGSRAWIKIRKIEVNYLMTAAVAIPASSTVTYKLTAEIYNEG